MHKMQRPRAQQGPLFCVHELLGRVRTNAIKTGGTGRVECDIYVMVCDLPDRKRTHHGKLSSVVEVYVDVPTIVL